MSTDDPTALTRDFGGEFELIQRLINKQLDQRGLTKGHEDASLGGDIVLAGWKPLEFVLFSLHILYQDHQQGVGDKYEVLGRCLNQALDMAEFLKRNLQLRMQQILSDAYACGSVSLSEAEAQEFVEKFRRLRLPRGRLRKQALKSKSVAPIYQAVLKVLRPGFKRDDKSVSRKLSVVKAVDWCIENLPGGNPTALKRRREEITERLLRARKPESAAVRLLSQALGVSESTLRRRLKGKQARTDSGSR